MFKKNYLRLIFIVSILASMLFTTCQHLSSLFPEPIVTLHSVEMTKIDFNGIEILCKVNVENRSRVSIPFPDIDWDLFINANAFLKGAISTATSGISIIEANAVTTIDVPVSFDYIGIFNTFMSLRNNINSNFRIAIGASFDLPYIGMKTWNFERDGVFPVLQMPKFSAPSFSMPRIDFDGIQLQFTVNVENPNVFAIPAPRLAYDFLIGNNPYLNNVQVSAAPLAAAAVTPVVVALAFNYADLYRLFQNLVNSSEVPSLLSMKGDFGSIPAFAGNVVNQNIPASIPLPKIPTVSFGGINVKNISLTRLDFEVPIEIVNSNVFAMIVETFSYNLNVNNSTWATGGVPGRPRIGANGTTIIPIAFSIDNIAVVRQITDIILRGTNVNYSFTGNMNMSADFPGLPNLPIPLNLSGITGLFNR